MLCRPSASCSSAAKPAVDKMSQPLTMWNHAESNSKVEESKVIPENDMSCWIALSSFAIRSGQQPVAPTPCFTTIGQHWSQVTCHEVSKIALRIHDWKRWINELGRLFFYTNSGYNVSEVCTWVHFYNRRFSIESNRFPAPQLWRKVTDRSFGFCNSLAASHASHGRNVAILGHCWRCFQGTMSCANWIRQSRCKLSWRLWIICHFGTYSTRTYNGPCYSHATAVAVKNAGVSRRYGSSNLMPSWVLKRSCLSGQSLRVGNCTFLSCQVSNMLDTSLRILGPSNGRVWTCIAGVYRSSNKPCLRGQDS